MTVVDGHAAGVVVVSRSPAETRAVGRDVARSVQAGAIIALEGELGAGKTEFVRGFVSECVGEDKVSSPTFSLLNTYECGGNRINHFDLYRIRSDVELHEMGFDEYLFSGETLLIEWPDRAEGWLPPGIHRIVIEHVDSTTRRISHLSPDMRSGR